jgi:signal transduction histidine kinase/CheY-like chemotaxis protein
VAVLAVPFFAVWCFIDMLEGDGSLRRLVVAHVDPLKVRMVYDLHSRFPPDRDATQGVWNILRTGESELISDIPDSLLVKLARDEELLRIMRDLGLKSYIGVPLKVREQTLGVITFIAAESEVRYDANDLAVAEDLAHRATVALENARLFRAVSEADRRKDEFLATLAHELRNPLAPIKNSVAVMRLRGFDNPELDWARDVIERQVEQMTRLVDDLLDISRISRGKVDLHLQMVDLTELVQRAVETTRPLLEESGHVLTISLPEDPVRLDADPTRLEQILANLLNNSAKYTERGGQIWLTADREETGVVIKVRDTGIGIAPGLLAHVFEMFVQADHAKDRAKGGLGIGLSLVRSLVEMHGGRITARSEGTGKGSEFSVYLPLAAEKQATAAAASPFAASTTPPTPVRRILVVDDNVDAAESLALLLRLAGHEAEVVNDGRTALEAVRAMAPEMVFLDIGLPGMDGYEVARQIRQIPGREEIFLLALTGWGQKEDRRRSKEAGFDRHLVKPLDPAMLRDLLADLESLRGG